MTQSNPSQPTANLIARTLESLRAVHADLSELTDAEGGIAALVQTSRGTTLLHDLRNEIDRLNKILPFKG